MTVWIVFSYDVRADVDGIYATEIEALRAAAKQYQYVAEVTLPCADVRDAIKAHYAPRP